VPSKEVQARRGSNPQSLVRQCFFTFRRTPPPNPVDASFLGAGAKIPPEGRERNFAA